MLTVLVVDDNALLRKLIFAHLHNKFEIIEASVGTTGLRIAREMHPDLILLDISMPGTLDGMDVLDELKADIETAYIPVIIITAHEFLPASSCIRKGAANYLIKPFSARQLLEIVNAALLNTECENPI